MRKPLHIASPFSLFAAAALLVAWSPLLAGRAGADEALLVPDEAAVAGPTAGGWELLKVEHGITVERRRVAGSALRELRGRGLVDAPLAAVLAVLEDEAQRAQQKAGCAGIESGSGRPGARSAILYDRTRAPWPVADRDVVLRADTLLDVAERTVRIDFVTTESACLPPIPGVVRMPFMRGHYVLRPAGGGLLTDVEYQVHADPGGTLPRWTANLASKQLPYTTIADLRKKSLLPAHAATAGSIAARPEYQSLMSHVATSK